LAAVVLLDVVTSYLPYLNDFYGPNSLSRFDDHDLYAGLAKAPKYNWSLLRGFGHPLNLTLALLISLATACWLLAELWPRQQQAGSARVPGLSWVGVAWLASSVWLLLGLWARWRTVDSEGSLSLVSAALFWLAATAFLAIALLAHVRSRSGGAGTGCVILLTVAWLVATGFLALGQWRYSQDRIDGNNPLSLYQVMNPVDEDQQMLFVVMMIYTATIVMLLLGFWTRLSALAVWALSWSFAGLNNSIDSNGDVARGILLFYLVVSPCGAAWSLDRWLARRWGAPMGPIYIHPWPLRLLWLQLICLYFFNGLYKLEGEAWRSGDSLYYVMANLAMSRVSYDQFQIPIEVLRVLSWTVLVWELSFPIVVVIPGVRIVALWFGVLFHVGIWASMELGAFSAYLLCFYLPLVPWERWVDRRRNRHASQPPGVPYSSPIV
jgi:hypothetical protein